MNVTVTASETAAEKKPARTREKKGGYRGLVGGVLYIEGIVTLAIGLVFLFSYWPPINVGKVHWNPISHVGMIITIIALTYLFGVGILLFFYNLLKPHKRREESSLVERSRRYAATGRREGYIFDETIISEVEAEEAWLARKLY